VDDFNSGACDLFSVIFHAPNVQPSFASPACVAGKAAAIATAEFFMLCSCV
jgi:hypothetical protein